jgi:hypothetical protein
MAKQREKRQKKGKTAPSVAPVTVRQEPDMRFNLSDDMPPPPSETFMGHPIWRY